MGMLEISKNTPGLKKLGFFKIFSLTDKLLITVESGAGSWYYPAGMVRTAILNTRWIMLQCARVHERWLNVDSCFKIFDQEEQYINVESSLNKS